MRRTAAGQPTETSRGGPEVSPTAIGQMTEDLLANYRAVQYHYVQFLTEHLADCSRSFGGDFDQVVILAVLGQRFLGATGQGVKGPAATAEMIWMPAMRVADVLGLPRETVRRKLKALEARGWVRQTPGKGWALAGTFKEAPARTALADLDRRGIERLARLYVAICISWPRRAGSATERQGVLPPIRPAPPSVRTPKPASRCPVRPEARQRPIPRAEAGQCRSGA